MYVVWYGGSDHIEGKFEMAQKQKPNFRSYSPKRSGSQQPKPQQRNFLGEPIHSKKQSGSGGNSRKVHDTKGRNTQGRRSW